MTDSFYSIKYIGCFVIHMDTLLEYRYHFNFLIKKKRNNLAAVLFRIVHTQIMGYLDTLGYFLIGVFILRDLEILSHALYVYILLKE